MKPLNETQIAELLASAAGDVSYQSLYSRTTALVREGRWTRKTSAYTFMSELKEAERKAAYVAPKAPTVAPGPRSQPYAGPFPRGKHSHRCKGCEIYGQYNAVACYKQKCTKPQLTATCESCHRRYA